MTRDGLEEATVERAASRVARALRVVPVAVAVHAHARHVGGGGGGQGARARRRRRGGRAGRVQRRRPVVARRHALVDRVQALRLLERRDLVGRREALQCCVRIASVTRSARTSEYGRTYRSSASLCRRTGRPAAGSRSEWGPWAGARSRSPPWFGTRQAIDSVRGTFKAGERGLLLPEHGEDARHLADGPNLVPDDFLADGGCFPFPAQKEWKISRCVMRARRETFKARFKFISPHAFVVSTNLESGYLQEDERTNRGHMHQRAINSIGGTVRALLATKSRLNKPHKRRPETSWIKEEKWSLARSLKSVNQTMSSIKRQMVIVTEWTRIEKWRVLFTFHFSWRRYRLSNHPSKAMLFLFGSFLKYKSNAWVLSLGYRVAKSRTGRTSSF